MNFGTYIHKIFELGYQLTEVKDLHRLSQQLKEDSNIPSRFENDTKKCINNFLRFNSKLEGETVGVELHDTIPLDKDNDIHFEFVIDRVIKGKDGGYLVIDYKTSKKEKSKSQLYLDKQLKGYAYAIHKLYEVPIEKITCAHFYPKTGNLVAVKFCKADIFYWKSKEIQKVWKIRKKTQNEMQIPMANQFCAFCQFTHICPLQTSSECVKQNIILEENKVKQQKVDKG